MKIFKEFYSSPMGSIEIRSDSKTIISLYFVEDKGKSSYRENPDILQECRKQLDEYFAGDRQKFNLKLNLTGTEFQKRVWQELLNIPFGETRSYKQIAKKIGNDKASRAVGAANSKNPISIIVPCHRVIAANGKLSGYTGGIQRKKWLLKFERRVSSNR